MPSEDRPLRLLISFAPKDRELKDELLKHLAVLVRFAGIELWEADRVRAGANWRQEVEAALERADVALVLLSSDFLASNFLQDVEVPKLFQRREQGGLKVIPVLLRSCYWQAHPWLGTLKPLPTSGEPIASFEGDRRDRAMTEVVREIVELTAKATRSTLANQRANSPQGNTLKNGDDYIPDKNLMVGAKRIEEAINVLKALGMPKQQQNERSALALLAFLALNPMQSWAQASSPVIGINLIMDFARGYYGKVYAPNTRETIRRQTVHQFLAAGLIVANPDEPARAANSPNNVYQIEAATLDVLKSYGSPSWETKINSYVAQKRTSAIRPMVPVVTANVADGGMGAFRMSATERAAREPVPTYPDAETRLLSEKLVAAQARKQRLQQHGANTAEVVQEILDLKRRLREGGQLKPGDSLGDGRYLLLDVLGRGGFATVWRAHDATRNEVVAIKVLHSNLAGDRVRLGRFMRGARVMQELECEAVVRVLEPYGEDGGWHYFVMEYLPGGDLRQAVLQTRIEQSEIVPLMTQVCEAVAVAHLRHIIHRDIKPANILLDERGRPKLTDFDLVGADDTTGGTRTGAVGTIVYTAPELLKHPTDIRCNADVYSLGMTTLFGLYGDDLPMEVLRGPEVVFDSIFLADSLREVLARAISWDWWGRYPDAGKFRDALMEATINPKMAGTVTARMLEEFVGDEAAYPPLFAEIQHLSEPPPGLPPEIEYKRMHNSRFGFSVDVPTFLVPQPAPANGDGRRFAYRKAVELAAWGMHQWDEKATARSLFQEAVEDAKHGNGVAEPEGFVDGNEYVLKSREGHSFRHRKLVLLHGVMSSIEFRYPAAQRAYFEPIASRVLASFRPPSGRDP